MSTSLVLYPRSYNQRGGEHLHSVMGLTPQGQEVNVKLRLDDEHKNKPNAPSVSEFAREDRKARQACIASPNNGPGQREGMLLFTQVTRDTLHRGPLPAYIAKWAAVLAEDSDSPDPLVGWGRLSIIRDSPDRLRLLRTLESAEAAGRDTETLRRSVDQGDHIGFQALLYHTESITRYPAGATEDILSGIAEAVDLRSHMGVMGGALIRGRTPSNRVVRGSCFEVFPRFLAERRGLQNGSETASEAREALRRLGVENSGWIDVIPMSRFHSGPMGNQYYASPERLRLIESRYEAYDGAPSVCRVAIRLSVFEDTQNTLLSRIYAMSQPVGSPDQLEDHGICLPYDDPDEESPSAELLPVIRMATWAELGRSILAEVSPDPEHQSALRPHEMASSDEASGDKGASTSGDHSSDGKPRPAIGTKDPDKVTRVGSGGHHAEPFDALDEGEEQDQEPEEQLPEPVYFEEKDPDDPGTDVPESISEGPETKGEQHAGEKPVVYGERSKDSPRAAEDARKAHATDLIDDSAHTNAGSAEHARAEPDRGREERPGVSGSGLSKECREVPMVQRPEAPATGVAAFLKKRGVLGQKGA